VVESNWGNERIRRLLDSAQVDAPPPHSLERTAAAIGVSPAALVEACEVRENQGVASPPSMPWVVARSAGVGALAGTVCVTVCLLLLEIGAPHRRDHYPAQARAAAEPNARQSADEARRPPRRPLPTTPAAPASVERSRPDVGLPTPSATPPRDEPPSLARFDDSSRARRLAIEVAFIDRARELLRSGQPRAALRELDRYERQCPWQELGVEAATLRERAVVARDASPSDASAR
jgi:hypothetical protein